MATKTQMNILIVILILGILCVGSIGLANTGHLEKEKKFVYLEKPDNYVTFDTHTHRAFIHFGSVNSTGVGSYIETDQDFNIYLDKSPEDIMFKK
jgi:hypothetical protein